MKAPEPKKVILLANCFDTLKYEIEAEVPHTLEEGKDLEVNLSLKTCLLRKTALTGLLRKLRLHCSKVQGFLEMLGIGLCSEIYHE